MKNYTLQDLLNLIDSYISSSISYDKFYSDFNDFFKDESEKSLSKGDFFEGINEALMFATENPDDEERSCGYIGALEFRKWLEEYKNSNISFWSAKS